MDGSMIDRIYMEDTDITFHNNESNSGTAVKYVNNTDSSSSDKYADKSSSVSTGQGKFIDPRPKSSAVPTSNPNVTITIFTPNGD